MQKILRKNSAHFHDKTVKQPRKRRDFPQSYTKVGHLQKSTANIIFNGERQCSTVKIKNKTGSLFLPFLFNTVLNILARVIRQNNKINSIQIVKEKVNYHYIWHGLVIQTILKNNTQRHTHTIVTKKEVSETSIQINIYRKSIAFL